jgi:hypothetical protein
MGAMMQLQVVDRECFDAINDGESMGYWPINHEFYEPIINMRRRRLARAEPLRTRGRCVTPAPYRFRDPAQGERVDPGST